MRESPPSWRTCLRQSCSASLDTTASEGIFDFGINHAYCGLAALPYFDEIDPSTIDVLLITQYVYSLR
ncbi:hypothetical protein IGI04_040074 [Brassica rapa subsp. trilocularis]|uniref:Uncharacterized protein n=1 Tax=Brassica rapa subsp. trilocularis TaxID=1813537 RepID=A0ABQ7KR11_BRACM|nr:hypothetical protein IGI04_040074 [Brassica rapa subsp. trilocularis]